ncbi:MAG: Beta-barrel assembly-enhancing protease [Planctomycetes bacterium]|nr:Beta-barrel assembly-enhancing protease [Planctomycetota bacterium]
MSSTVSELIASARNLRDVRRYDLAIQQLSRALEMEPDNVEALRNLAECRWYAGDRELAQSAVEAALRVAPNSSWVRLTAAWTSANSGRYQDAMVHAQAALEIDPGAAYAHLHWAEAHYGLGDYAAATARVAHAISALPDDAYLRARHAVFLAMERQYDAARAELRHALQLDPASAHAHYLLGWLERVSGNPVAAEAAQREALRIDPSNRGAADELQLAQSESDAAAARNRREEDVNEPAGPPAGWRLLLTIATMLALAHLHGRMGRPGVAIACGALFATAWSRWRPLDVLVRHRPTLWSWSDEPEGVARLHRSVIVWTIVAGAVAAEAGAHRGILLASLLVAVGFGGAGALAGCWMVRRGSIRGLRAAAGVLSFAYVLAGCGVTMFAKLGSNSWPDRKSDAWTWYVVCFAVVVAACLPLAFLRLREWVRRGER